METHCTPRSPVEKTSTRLRAKQANISTDHFPKPRTAVNFSTSSSSEARASIRALNSPLANFSASPCIYSALRCDSPAVRSVAISQRATSCGVGNRERDTEALSSALVGSNSARNLLRIDFAAAPETCCPMILLVKLLNGSICSARPTGENSGQWCCSMTALRRGSAAIRWDVAWSSKVPVVAAGRGSPVFEGEASSTWAG